MQPVNIALVGLGYWGKNLLRSFNGLPEARIHTLCDLDEKNLNAVKSICPQAKATRSFEEVLANPEIQAVAIATPSSTHFRNAKAALEAGKHTFVEKPLAMDLKEAEQLVEISERVKKTLMVGHLLKHHPVTHYLKNLIDKGDLGEIYCIYTQRLNLGIIRSDENPLWSLSTHDISLILYFLGEMPDRVWASGAGFLQKDIEDVVFAGLGFPSGHIAHLHLSWLDPHKTRRLTIVGSKKMAVFDDMEPREKLRIYDKGTKKAVNSGTLMEYHMAREGDIQIPMIEASEPLRLECQNFLQTVGGVAKSNSDGPEALRILKVIMGLDQSLKQKGKVCELR